MTTVDRNIWLGYSDDFDFWGKTIGSTSPSTVVEQASEAGQDLLTWAREYAADWPFEPPLSEEDEEAAARRIERILARAADAEVQALEAHRDQLGLGYDDLGPVDCVEVAFHDGRGYYIGDDGAGDWYTTAEAAQDALEEWAHMQGDRLAERAEEARMYALEEANDLADARAEMEEGL